MPEKLLNKLRREKKLNKLRREKQLNKLRSMYPSGTRVKLLNMDDNQAPPYGTLGTIRNIDDMGTIHVLWDTGSSLGLVYGVDKFETIVD